MMSITRIALCAVLGASLAACGDNNNNNNKIDPTPTPSPAPPEPSLTYSAEVRRTEYGIPHIKAED